MSVWNTVHVGSFLNERKDRFEPDEANKLGLKRLYKIDFSGKIHLLDDKQTNTGMILVKKGDLVISGINVEKGAIAVYQGDGDILATIHYSSYEFDKSKIDVGYFTWFLRSQTFRDVVQSQVRGGIKTELKPKHFLPLKINLPDLPIQQKIKKRIGGVSNEIKEINELDVNNEDYVTKLRQAILQEAVSGKLVPQDQKDEPASELLKKIKVEKEKLIREKKIKKDKPLPPITEEEIPYELPKGWEWVRLGDITKIIAGNSFLSQDFNEIKGTKVIKITNCGVKEFVETDDYLPEHFIDEYTDFLIHEKDLVIALTRPYISNGLKICKCPASYNNSLLNQRVAAIKNKFKINFEYLHYFLTTDFVLNKYQSRFRNSGLQPNLKMEDLTLLEVPLPPLPEQIRIVEKVDQLMKLCDELEEKVQENQTNTGLLMEAVLREAFEVKESGSIGTD